MIYQHERVQQKEVTYNAFFPLRSPRPEDALLVERLLIGVWQRAVTIERRSALKEFVDFFLVGCIQFVGNAGDLQQPFVFYLHRHNAQIFWAGFPDISDFQDIRVLADGENGADAGTQLNAFAGVTEHVPLCAELLAEVNHPADAFARAGEHNSCSAYPR